MDVSTWGATLVSRRVVEAGVLPDPELFFGFEDFDFFCRTRAAGFSVLVDVPCARRVAPRQTLAARDESLHRHRPVDAEEPWRAYYFARNFFALARRHGRRSWMAWHLLYSARRLQLASGTAERVAIVRGLADGVRGRLGVNPVYLRTVGERPAPGVASSDPDGALEVVTSETTPSVVALVLSHNAPMALRRCLDAMAHQTVTPTAVVVVDNASNPPVGSDPPVTTLPLSVLRSEVNLGPAGGWAMAFEEFGASSFDYAWVLDDDIVPDPECLEVLLAEASPDPKGAFLFPWAVQPDGSVGGWGSWCGFIVSRHIVEQVGVPMAELFWWAEDNEYCLWRIPQAGFKRRIVDGAVVQHDAIRQGGRIPTWKYYYEARNMLYLHLHVMHRLGWYPRNVTKLVARALLRERGKRVASVRAMTKGWNRRCPGAPWNPLSDRAHARTHPGRARRQCLDCS